MRVCFFFLCAYTVFITSRQNQFRSQFRTQPDWALWRRTVQAQAHAHVESIRHVRAAPRLAVVQALIRRGARRAATHAADDGTWPGRERKGYSSIRDTSCIQITSARTT